MTPIRRNGPTTASEAASTTHTDATNHTCVERICGVGEVCVCEFYSDWTIIWPTTCDEPVSVQLRRRRASSWRSPRLECGRRDPISAVAA